MYSRVIVMAKWCVAREGPYVEYFALNRILEIEAYMYLQKYFQVGVLKIIVHQKYKPVMEPFGSDRLPSIKHRIILIQPTMKMRAV